MPENPVLFDVSPVEAAPQKKRARAKSRAVFEGVEETQKTPSFIGKSPVEAAPQKKRARAKSRAVFEGVEETQKTPSFIGKSPAAAVIKPVGKIDDTYQCIDDRCQAQCHDILHEEAGMWFLSCAFCGCTRWLRAIPGVIQPREEQFQLRDGRFAGQTLDEVATQPHGLDYIRWAAKSHHRSAVKDACKAWLDHSRAAQ